MAGAAPRSAPQSKVSAMRLPAAVPCVTTMGVGRGVGVAVQRGCGVAVLVGRAVGIAVGVCVGAAVRVGGVVAVGRAVLVGDGVEVGDGAAKGMPQPPTNSIMATVPAMPAATTTRRSPEACLEAWRGISGCMRYHDRPSPRCRQGSLDAVVQ